MECEIKRKSIRNAFLSYKQAREEDKIRRKIRYERKREKENLGPSNISLDNGGLIGGGTSSPIDASSADEN